MDALPADALLEEGSRRFKWVTNGVLASLRAEFERNGSSSRDGTGGGGDAGGAAGGAGAGRMR